MLKESKDTTLEYQRLSKDEMESRGILGRLVGVCADFFSPTRNGRKYPEKLWENVFADPIMKERIENGVCYGELGHPADREETDMEKIALCLAEVPKKGSDGKLRAVFDILNTPNGRILKSLCDYGSTIGISSRGSGDLETDFDGNESVNPDTYTCEGFDAVLIPAVKEARLQYVTESLNKTRYNKTLRDKLTESINKEDEKHQKIVRESLNTFGIKLDESQYNGYEIQITDSGALVRDSVGNVIQEFPTESEAREWVDEQLSILDESIVVEVNDIEQSLNDEQLDVQDTPAQVMESYQNANKWLDSVKEFLYIEMSCPFFSSFVHNLAHSMPERFDKFGDILHTDNIQIPYPATAELQTELTSISDAFDVIFMSLDNIKQSLNDFIKDVDEIKHGMACSAETLLNDIESEYPMLYRLKDKWEQCDGNTVEFDKYVMQYVEHKDDLIEQLNKNTNAKFNESLNDVDKYEEIIRSLRVDFDFPQVKIYPNGDEVTFDFGDGGITIDTYDEDVTDTLFNYIKATYTRTDNDLDESLGSGNQGKLNTILYKYAWKALTDYANQYMSEDEDFSYSELKKAFGIIEMRICGQYSDKVNEDINQETDDINSDEKTNEVVNDESLVEELQKALKLNKKLDEKIVALQEKLSVGYAKEMKLNEQIEGYKARIVKLSKSTNEAKALNEKLNTITKSKETVDNKCNLLKESVNKRNDAIKKLNESVIRQNERLKESNNKLKSSKAEITELNESLSTLTDKYETLNKDMNQLKESYSRKIEQQNSLVEKYKHIAMKSVDKYIDTQATRLGVRSAEIRNRLPESYSFKDIDSICEDLQEYKLNMSNLPFSTHSRLSEGMEIKASNVSQRTLVPQEEDIDELTLRLAGL